LRQLLGSPRAGLARPGAVPPLPVCPPRVHKGGTAVVRQAGGYPLGLLIGLTK